MKYYVGQIIPLKDNLEHTLYVVEILNIDTNKIKIAYHLPKNYGDGTFMYTTIEKYHQTAMDYLNGT